MTRPRTAAQRLKRVAKARHRREKKGEARAPAAEAAERKRLDVPEAADFAAALDGTQQAGR